LEKPDLSVICPAYNDEKNIGPLAERILEVLSPVCGGLEIVLVEDGSPDGTGRAVDALAAEFPQVRAFHHERNMGHGAALKTGFRNSRFPFVAFMDGDGQYDPLDVPAMLARLARADAVQGRRIEYPNGWRRLLLSKFYNFVVRWYFGAPFRDLGCSIKVLKRDVVERCLPECDGIFMQGELVMRAYFAGYNVEETDVMCYPRASGKSSSLAARHLVRLAADFRKFVAGVKSVKNRSI